MGLFDKGAKTNYRPALKWLQYMYPSLHTHVLNLGKPEYRYTIPTAAVEHHGEGIVASSRSHYFNFIINPEFEKSLSEEDYAFILSHETFHILLGHLAVFHKYDNHKRFNIATDCIINDWLYSFGIEPEKFEPMYGPNIVGFDTSQSSLDEIYRLIPDEMCEGEPGECNGNCDGTPDDSGQAGSGTCTCPQTVDDHNSMFGSGDPNDPNGGKGQIDPTATDEAIRKFIEDGNFDSLPNQAKDFVYDNNPQIQKFKKDDRPAGGWSPTGFGLSIADQMADGVELAWGELMAEISPDLYNAGNFSAKSSRSFARPNKKNVVTYPKVIMPSRFFEVGGVGNRREKDENTFVLALDHSGSVTEEDKRKFRALAASIPQKKARVFGCTFSTNYVPYDVNGGPGQPVANGGTDFGAIEQFIQEQVVQELGKYPKAVVVITDGYATFARATPTDEQLQNGWYWLIVGGRVTTSDNRINSAGKLYDIDKFVK